jgi:hypothetical protein
MWAGLKKELQMKREIYIHIIQDFLFEIGVNREARIRKFRKWNKVIRVVRSACQMCQGLEKYEDHGEAGDHFGRHDDEGARWNQNCVRRMMIAAVTMMVNPMMMNQAIMSCSNR